MRAKKSLGQNFLIDKTVARRIVQFVSPLVTDLILEIGPGRGALTRPLVQSAGRVYAIEIDHHLAEELRSSIKSENLVVIEQDALTTDWSALISDSLATSGCNRARVVANLPYYISTAILERLLAIRGANDGARLYDLTLMLQREVVDRITSGPGSRDYGYLSLFVQYHAEVSRLFEVAREAFAPVPKVESAVVHCRLRPSPAVQVADEADFFFLVQAAFAHRRKTILNNLKAWKPAGRFQGDVDAGLRRAGIAPQRRAETISMQEFARLYAELFG